MVQAAKLERELLTKAALRTVHQVQEYVSGTLGWLGSLNSTADTPPPNSKTRHRWGFTPAAADPPAKKSRWGAKEPAPPPNPLQARLDEVNR